MDGLSRNGRQDTIEKELDEFIYVYICSLSAGYQKLSVCQKSRSVEAT